MYEPKREEHDFISIKSDVQHQLGLYAPLLQLPDRWINCSPEQKNNVGLLLISVSCAVHSFGYFGFGSTGCLIRAAFYRKIPFYGRETL